MKTKFMAEIKYARDSLSTGLALLNIHSDINVDVIEVIDRFSNTKDKKDFA